MDKNNYAEVCFSLKEKQKELKNFKFDTFILQPEINSLIEEIDELENIKKELEKDMED